MFTETEFYMKDYRFLEFKTNTSKQPIINIYVNHLSITLQPEAFNSSIKDYVLHVLTTDPKYLFIPVYIFYLKPSCFFFIDLVYNSQKVRHKQTTLSVFKR